MNIFNIFRDVLEDLVKELTDNGALPAGLDLSRVSVESPRDPSHGDMATNTAMVLAKPAGMNPRAVAELLKPGLEGHEDVASVEIAGPGFINFRLSDAFWQARIPEILAAGTAYGDSDIGSGEAVNVEFTSANPTGPLHVGHTRGAVFGDALAGLLNKAGYKATREYYINDAGAQVDVLARSVHLRYRQALGADIGEIPEGLYPADYLIPLGQALAAEFGDQYAELDEDAWLQPFRAAAINAMMDLIRGDLAAAGIKFDVFSSEKALHDSGELESGIQLMADKGLLYKGVLEPPKGKRPDDWEAREQTLFRATDFGDDVDRAIAKSDGSATYFASDIAYHRDKIERGFNNMVLILGADHGGYVKRMKAVVAAISDRTAEIDVKLCQLVKLFRDGEPVRMSKRAGKFVTMRDVVDEVGKDVLRFIMLTRKNEAPLDFDFAKVMDQSRDNPVFYVQYAHARVHSVLRRAEEASIDVAGLEAADVSKLAHPAELSLIRLMASWPRIVEQSALSHEPHRIAFYLYELASEFHTLWNQGNDDPGLRFIIDDDADLTRARLAMIVACSKVIASGLAVLGVEPVEEMHG